MSTNEFVKQWVEPGFLRAKLNAFIDFSFYSFTIDTFTFQNLKKGAMTTFVK